MTVQQALVQATGKLKTSNSPTLDAELLLSHVLHKPREYVFTHPDQDLRSTQQIQLWKLVSRRGKRVPMAYILGHKEFFGLDFALNNSVLIPRPETELVVEEVIRLMAQKPQPKLVDIGVGSGAIAIALKTSLPNAHVYGTDSSRKALAVSKRNARRLKTKIHFKHGSLLSPFPQVRFDCVISNPPYLTAKEIKNPDLSHEPRAALYGGKQGVDVYRKLFSLLDQHVVSGGHVVLEIGYNQALAVTRLAKHLWPKVKIKIIPDLAGLDRVLSIQIP